MIKQNTKDTRLHRRITDGAPQHFKHSDIAYYLSRQQIETLIKGAWLFHATAHGKDLGDSEGGACKHVGDRVQMEAGEGKTMKIHDASASVYRSVTGPNGHLV